MTAIPRPTPAKLEVIHNLRRKENEPETFNKASKA
jgi:hypothetical protein